MPNMEELNMEDHKRPNRRIEHIENRSGLRVRPNEFIKRDKPTMCIRNNWRKI